MQIKLRIQVNMLAESRARSTKKLSRFLSQVFAEQILAFFIANFALRRVIRYSDVIALGERNLHFLNLYYAKFKLKHKKLLSNEPLLTINQLYK